MQAWKRTRDWETIFELKQTSLCGGGLDILLAMYWTMRYSQWYRSHRDCTTMVFSFSHRSQRSLAVDDQILVTPLPDIY